jgi:hypothetical protein
MKKDRIKVTFITTGCALCLCLFAAMPSHASIIRVSPPAPANTCYKDLVCTPQHQACIHEIITMMADHSKFSLLVNQPHLKQLGVQVQHVHPLKFLSTIFLNPTLKNCMASIFDDYFKRNGFLGDDLSDGLGPSLNRECDKGKIEPYLQDFANEMKVPIEQLRPYFAARDWENLVRYLIQS